jgi:hypothetical protein
VLGDVAAAGEVLGEAVALGEAAALGEVLDAAGAVPSKSTTKTSSSFGLTAPLPVVP